MDEDLIAALTAALLVSLVAGIYGYSKGAGNICASYGLEYTNGKCTKDIQEVYLAKVQETTRTHKSRLEPTEARSELSD